MDQLYRWTEFVAILWKTTHKFTGLHKNILAVTFSGSVWPFHLLKGPN